MINVLEIGTYGFAGNDIKRKEELRNRRIRYSEHLNHLSVILYSSRNIEKSHIVKESGNLDVYYVQQPTRRISFPWTVLITGIRICRSKPIDVISAQDPFKTALIGYILKVLFRASLNIQVHSDMINNPLWANNIYDKLNDRLGRYILKRADAVRVVSERIKTKLIALGVKESRIIFVPTPICADDFLSAKCEPTRRNILNNTFDKIVLFVGRLSSEKNLPFLLNSFRLVVNEYPGALLLLVGNGKERAPIQEIVKRLNLDDNVKMLGSVDYSDIPNIFAAADLFVLTSIFEGRATVLVEAAISKKPVIATNISGTEEWLINDKTGFIVEHNNTGQLADKILFMLRNPGTAEQYGNNGFALAKEKLKDTDKIKSIVSIWEETARMKSSCQRVAQL
ncbi:glycosyltransferase family 4 protein [Candidatus Omnitrophota bacterium]